MVTSRAVPKFNFHTMLTHNPFLKKQIKQINQARMRIQFDNFIFISETTITPTCWIYGINYQFKSYNTYNNKRWIKSRMTMEKIRKCNWTTFMKETSVNNVIGVLDHFHERDNVWSTSKTMVFMTSCRLN